MKWFSPLLGDVAEPIAPQRPLKASGESGAHRFPVNHPQFSDDSETLPEHRDAVKNIFLSHRTFFDRPFPQAIQRDPPATSAMAIAAQGSRPCSRRPGADLLRCHCTDDSPHFAATWYPLAVLLLAAAGAAAAATRW